MLVRAPLLICLIIGAVMAAAGPIEGPPAVPAQNPGAAEKSESPKPPEPKTGDQADPGDVLRRLSHEDYQERKAAQAALLEWGKQDLEKGIDTLYGVYRESDDPEVRLRSREVLKRLVIIKQPFEGPGYLGVRMEDAQVKDAEGELQPAVLITEVREGTAAEVAKLQIDDLVTGVDEAVFNDLRPIIGFAEYIKGKQAGDEITLHVRRGEATLHLKALLRRRPPQLDRLSQWGTTLLDLPKQSELDESDFQDWLRSRETEERNAAEGRKPDVPPPAR